VFKEQFEDKADMKIQSNAPITQWMVRWAGMVTSRYIVGKDGCTGYERRRGRRCNLEVVPFGEVVLYKQIRDGKERKNKFDCEWQEGIWLCHCRDTPEVLIGTKDGVVKAYTIERQLEEFRWSKELIDEMQGTPQQPDPTKPGTRIPIRITFDEPQAVEVEESQPARNELGVRRFKIMKRLLVKYGYSEDCDGCRYQRAGIAGVDHRGHSEACRQRIYDAIAQTEKG